MSKLKRMDSEEGLRLYREYRVEKTKQILGYGLIVIGALGAIVSPSLAGRPKSLILQAVFVTIVIAGIVIHQSRKATKEAAKIKISPKRRFLPPPMESSVAGARRAEISEGEYHIRLGDVPEDDEPGDEIDLANQLPSPEQAYRDSDA